MKAARSKQFVSMFLNRQKIASAMTPVVLLVIGLITIRAIAPCCFPKFPWQPHVRDITVVIPVESLNAILSSLRGVGFRHVHALSYDPHLSAHSFFTSFQHIAGSFGDDVSNFCNTSFVLFGGRNVFKVPANLPKLPNRPMVIGYTFAQCYERGFGLLMPTGLEHALITKDAMQRFSHFSVETLNGQRDANEAFRIFCDLHSLRLLMMPCNGTRRTLPRWESIEAVEYESESSFEPWGKMEKIEEVWKIRDSL